MIIGAGGSIVVIILAIIIIATCCSLKPKGREDYNLPRPNSTIPLQSSTKSVDSTKIQREITTDSLAGEDTETKAAINDKQVSTLYYCGNWQA